MYVWPQQSDVNALTMIRPQMILKHVRLREEQDVKSTRLSSPLAKDLTNVAINFWRIWLFTKITEYFASYFQKLLNEYFALFMSFEPKGIQKSFEIKSVLTESNEI